MPAGRQGRESCLWVKYSWLDPGELEIYQEKTSLEHETIFQSNYMGKENKYTAIHFYNFSPS